MPADHTTAMLRSLVLGGLLLSPLLAAGAEMPATPPKPSDAVLRPTLLSQSWAIEAPYWRLVPDDASITAAAANGTGLWLVDAHGNALDHLSGRFASLDLRSTTDGLILASVATGHERATLAYYDTRTRRFGAPLQLAPSAYKIEALCLYRDDADNLLLFTVGEEGHGDQWLVGSGGALLDRARHVRGLSLPPQSKSCAVDDQRHLLYVSEENLGIWAYGAHPEAESSREPVDLRQPFGSIKGTAGALEVSRGNLLATDPQSRQLRIYQPGIHNWARMPALDLAETVEPEWLSGRSSGEDLELLLIDNEDDVLYLTRLPGLPKPPAAPAALPTVVPLVATESVPSVGDAADDPAIWPHPERPEDSRILGTDKRAGLGVYDLAGRQLQFLPAGRLNNVDIRSGFRLAGETVDLAVASNRDNNSLHMFAIDRSNGELSELGELGTPLDEIYGLCMSQSPLGDIYVIVNDKDGRFLQFRLNGADGRVRGQLVRQFRVPSQPEGCVADDRRQRLFIGEENAAVWALDSAADASTEFHQVIGVGDLLQADIEGLGLYQHPQHPYLVVSSQGSDSFLVLDAEPPYAVRGAFRVSLNAPLDIDGVSETDGLDVTSSQLGGPWNRGLLVVQDGRKRMPEGAQNYKYLPWKAVAERLQLP